MQQFWHLINEVELTSTTAIVRIVLSLVLGSLVGIERKRKGQMAGLRTFSLISMGACIAMMLSIYVCQETVGLLRGDPSRIAAQVLSGIGFLGAGTIIQMKGSVRGLTTAAGIWMTAIIGMAVGVGMYWSSIIATVLILVILVAFEYYEHRANLGQENRAVKIVVRGIVQDIRPYEKVFSEHKVHLSTYFIDYDYEHSVTNLSFIILSPSHRNYLPMFADLRAAGDTVSLSLASQV